MTSLKNYIIMQKSDKLQSILDSILKEEQEIRFVALIDDNGNLVQEVFREDIVPLESAKERKKIFLELALRVTKRKEFDYSMGRVKYSASRREKVVMMSFPVEGGVLMITTDPLVNIDRLGYSVILKLDRDWKSFFGK